MSLCVLNYLVSGLPRVRAASSLVSLTPLPLSPYRQLCSFHAETCEAHYCMSAPDSLGLLCLKQLTLTF